MHNRKNDDEIFHITNTDKRKEFEKAYENNTFFNTQKWSGYDVEHFSANKGFVLLQKEWNLRLNSKKASTAYVISKLSHNPRTTLREIYYTLRQTPKYQKYFNPKDFYTDVINAVNHLEIICDIDRNIFVQGQPKGIFFYPHNYTYGDSQRLIALSEDLVTKTVNDYDVTYAMNVLAIEKMSIAAGLVADDSIFPKLINAIVASTGGQYDRAIRKMMGRWQNSKHTMALCDGDVWGVYMVQTTHLGSKNSRHLDDKMPNVADAGLYPSVARDCGCPEDIDEKKPMNSDSSRKRIKLLSYIGYSPTDLNVFKNNLTYELEALNTRFKDPEGRKIGVQIYITELLRALNRPCKPQPTEDNFRLTLSFKRSARNNLQRQITHEVNSESPIYDLKEMIEDKIGDIINSIIDKIYKKYKEELENKIEVTADTIRDKIAEQYQNSPEIEIYDLDKITNEIISKVKVEVKWNPEDLKEVISDALDDYVTSLGEDIYSETVELQELTEPEDIQPFYDTVLKHIKADPEDAKLIREALNKRL